MRHNRLIAALPKAELHVHLEGTLEPDLLIALGRRNGVSVPWTSIEQARAAYTFTGLDNFLQLLWQSCAVLRTRQDFYDLTIGYLERAASDNVVRAEMMFGAQTFLDHGISIADQLDGVLAAVEDARQQWGIDGAVLLTAQRHRLESSALELLELTSPWAESILGYGLGGAERANPPVKFARFFTACRERGFRTTIHAGEDGPADYIRQALEVCGAERIDHGVAAAADLDLMHRLAEDQITLTMCPLSNLRLHVVSSLAAHPLATLLDAGVRVTINSDDPPYFGGYLNDNYIALSDGLGLNDGQVATLARNSVLGSFLDAADIADHLRAVDLAIARVREPTEPT